MYFSSKLLAHSMVNYVSRPGIKPCAVYWWAFNGSICTRFNVAYDAETAICSLPSPILDVAGCCAFVLPSVTEPHHSLKCIKLKLWHDIKKKSDHIVHPTHFLHLLGSRMEWQCCVYTWLATDSILPQLRWLCIRICLSFPIPSLIKFIRLEMSVCVELIAILWACDRIQHLDKHTTWHRHLNTRAALRKHMWLLRIPKNRDKMNKRINK